MKQLFKRETMAYLFFGILTTAVYFLVRFFTLHMTGESVHSVIVAQIVAILFAFVTNKIAVFQDKEWGLWNVLKQLSLFIVGRLAVFFLDVVVTYLAVETYATFFISSLHLNSINYETGIFQWPLFRGFIGTPFLLNELLFALLIQVLGIIINYVISKLIVFKSQKEDIQEVESTE